jgi:radical SAM superfamily enzyme YgiQ (UPF0313 family)
MRIGIIELIMDTVSRNWVNSLYAAHFRRQFYGIVPQAVSVWCRELGHQVFYTTYYGQKDPKSLLPNDLDVVFISAFTQASALAYALAKLYCMEKTLTVIGGPHAKSFPEDCLRFFDIVVKECDKDLIDKILRKEFDPPSIVSTDQPLTDLPTVEERMPEIAKAAFSGGKPTLTSFVPILTSVGCPYHCDFCMDWNNKYISLPRERLEADLRFLSRNLPDTLIIYHDPNFAVRFDELMDVFERIPENRRNRYLMQTTLSNLKPSRLQRLRSTKCIFVAPGIESWMNYSNKASVSGKTGREKLEKVIRHFELLRQYFPDLQANFIFGTDADNGNAPVELTKEFIRRLPYVWPAMNIPTPFAGTPFFDQLHVENRIIKSLPLSFYYRPFLVIKLKNYSALEFYEYLIDLYALITSTAMMGKRIFARSAPEIKVIYTVRAFHLRQELAQLRRVRDMLVKDGEMRAFHEGRSNQLPEFYHQCFEKRLGRFAGLISRSDRIPVLSTEVEHNGSTVSLTGDEFKEGENHEV